MEAKVCSKCSVEKALEDFPYKNKELGIRNSVCKVCQRQYKKDHYNNNKEAHYNRNNITQQKIRNYVDSVKYSGCFMCNETFKQCLEFHHLDSSTKEGNISQLISRGSLIKVQEEIEKCVILCANCHRKVHYDENYNQKMQVLITGSQSVSKTE